jgi:hypothetical protein
MCEKLTAGGQCFDLYFEEFTVILIFAHNLLYFKPKLATFLGQKIFSKT